MIDLPPPQVHCVAQAVYHEARGESLKGQRAVAHVIINRSKNRGLTPCQVIKQKGQFHFRTQAKYAGAAWDQAYKIASTVLSFKDPTGGASFFHNLKVSPKWRLTRTATIGQHVFYRK